MNDWIIRHSPDDAFYYLQLADGKTSWLETNGYHPLWAIIISLLGIPLSGWALVYATTGLYFFLVFSIPFIVWKLYGTKLGFLTWVVPALIFGNVMMELPLTVIIILFAYKFRNEKWSALLFYSRLDTLPLAIMTTPRKRWWVLTLLILPYFAFNLIVFHTIIPDGVRHSGFEISWANWIGLLSMFNIVLLPFAIFGALLSHRILVLQGLFTFITNAIRGSAFAWHHVTLPVILILGIHSLSKKNPYFKYGAIIFLFLHFPIMIYLAFENRGYEWQRDMYQSAPIPTGYKRGAYNSGIQGFFSNEKVHNMDGVFKHDIEDVEVIIDFASYIPEEYERIYTLRERTDKLGDFGVFVRK